MTTNGEYYRHARAELLDLLPAPPRRLLDVGCGSGATSALAKRRWPGVETIGIEVVAEAAQAGAAHLDRLIVGSVETVDLAREGVAGVDAVVLGDVLEHLVDPWRFLERLHAVLTPGAQIAASIPNAANLWLIEELAAGRFDYAAEGLLDRTHLRFFTRRTIAALFAGARYAITRWERVTDGRIDDLTRRRVFGVMLPPRRFGALHGRRVRVRGVGAGEHDDLRTLQYLVLAQPERSAHPSSGV